MAKKDKNKNLEAEKFKAGDVVKTDQGEEIELDEEGAKSLNDQMNEGANEDSKEESKASASKKTGNVKKAPNGTFRFNKFKRK